MKSILIKDTTHVIPFTLMRKDHCTGANIRLSTMGLWEEDVFIVFIN